MKAELILEGGGMRGVYTAGVLDFFMDKKIKFKDITAVSAGVCVATSYLSEQRGRTLQILTEYSTDKRYLSVESLLKTGSAFGIDFIFKTIPDELLPFDYDKYLNSGCNLTAVCTDYSTGKPYYALIDNLKDKINYVIASCSLPMVSKPVKVDGLTLYDGGVSDPIPIRKSLEGFDYQVLVLTRDGYYRKSNSLSNRMITKRFFRHKEFSAVLGNRHNTYNDSLDVINQLESENKAIVIRPSQQVTIDRFEKDPIRLKALYDLGYHDAQNKYDSILALSNIYDNIEIDK